MRKVHQLHAQSRFLPSIGQTTSRKELKKTDLNCCKENNNQENKHPAKFKMQPAHHCLPRKNNFKKEPVLIQDILDKKLENKEKTDVPTQPKTNRPWVAKEVDMNKMTTRTSRMISLLPSTRNIQTRRRKSCQANTPEQSVMEPRLVTLEDETLKMPKKTMSKAISLPRDKIYSCKIAMKKGVFPINQKRFEHEKMVEFFQQDQIISTIQDKSECDQEDLFMSFESYLQMDL